MKTRRVLSLGAFLALVLATPVWSADPGIYHSGELGGGVLASRMVMSEAEGLKPGAGDVFSWASWDGKQLGTQWSVTCAVQLGLPATQEMMDAKGNGYRTVVSTFEGGRYLMTRLGPWGGFSDARGSLNRTEMTAITTYSEFKPTNIDVFIDARGVDKLGRFVRFTAKKCTGWGEMNAGVPTAYPPLLDLACQATRDEGYWWDMSDVTIEIAGLTGSGSAEPMSTESPTAAPSHSWGAVKVIYR